MGRASVRLSRSTAQTDFLPCPSGFLIQIAVDPSSGIGNINVAHGTRDLADKILESGTRVPNSAGVGSDTMGWEKALTDYPFSTPTLQHLQLFQVLTILRPYITHISSS